MADQAKAKNFEFKRMISQFGGYISSIDPTNVTEDVLVKGSLNVYKKLSGTYAVRQGQKRRGIADATLSPCSSEFVWNTSWGQTYTMVVSKSTLYAVLNNVWYAVQGSLTKTRYVFDKWWNTSENKDVLVFVNGTSNLFSWSGGIATVDFGTTNQAILMNSTSASLTSFGTMTGTATFSTSYNGLTGTLFQNAIVFTGNPTNGQTMIFTVNGNSISVQFVTVIGAVAGNVLIGANLAATITNLLGLLNFTNTTSATQVAFSAPNQVFMNYFSSATTNTLTKTNPTISWAQSGFSASGVININGTAYTYTGGVNTSILYGVTPDPSGIANGTLAVQAIVTTANTPTSTFNSDFLKVINNQVYLGSYTSLNIFMSSSISYTNYTVPTPQLDGSPGLFIMPSTAKGIGVRQGNAFVGAGSDRWVEISFTLVSNNNIITRNNKVDYKPVARLQAPYAHEFIDSVGDTIVYLTQDQQVRSLGDFNNLFVAGYPSYSQEISTELTQETFTGGGLKCIGEFIYVTAPNSGKVYLRQERTRVDVNGSITAERIWHSPFIWNTTFIDQIDGDVVAFSNANPQIYSVWNTDQWHDDSPSDEPLPYSCVAAFGYRGEQRRQGLWSFDKQYTEGYITLGTELNLLMNYNYRGATNQARVPINSLAQPAYIFSTPPSSLGDSSLGDEPLGAEPDSSETDDLLKFKVINSLPLINCFEWQPVYYSDVADAQWEILAVATNADIEAEQQPIFIINKNRNI